MLPDNSNPLKQNPFALLWCCRTHQFCRFCCQLLIAGRNRRKQCTCNCNHRSLKRIAHMIRNQDCRQMFIQAHIGINNDKRQNLFTDQYPENTSTQSCDQSISNVFSCDCSFSITKRLHRSDLDPLFLYHSCHSCQTDQCCHQEEQHRKYLSNRTHTVCIIPVSLIFRQCIFPRLHIPFRILDLFNLCFRICDLLFCIRELPFSVCNLRLSVCNLIFRVFCCLLIFTPARRKFLFSGCNLRLTCI